MHCNAFIPVLAKLSCLIFISLAVPANAQTDWSATIAAKGLAATEAELAALAAPTDADLFALGGVRFLGAIEVAVQTRWNTGMTDTLRMFPLFRLPIPDNPAAKPFEPAVIADLVRDVVTRLDAARDPLANIPDGSEFGLTIRFADLWFDVNGNAVRDSGEDLAEIAGPILLGPQWNARDPATPLPVIRFDAADARWLSAYTHLMGGLGDMVLAYDPTAPITEVLAARKAFADLRAPGYADPLQAMEFDLAADVILATLRTLDQQPDAARMASAHSHFLSMIADNRQFWALVALETDNEAEWLPNPSQTSALGMTFPPETADLWLAVLDESEALLKGEILAPYWRLDDSAGVNVARMFSQPAPIDVLGWIQGADALPYIEKGKVMTGESWMRFAGMMGGEAMLMTLFLN